MSKKTSNPYVNGRREWMERYGDYIKSAQNWRLAALGGIATSVVLAIGLTTVASQSRVQPYVVKLADDGKVITVEPAKASTSYDQVVIRGALMRWIEDWRLVTVDYAAQKRAVERVYAMLTQQAAGKINKYYKEHDPFERAKVERVFPVVKAITPLGGNLYQIEWQERRMSATTGSVLGTETYKANIRVKVQPAQDEQTILRNPLGIWIEDIEWARVNVH